MLIYFSGTGNTRSVAEMLAEKLNEPLVHLLEYSPEDLRFKGERLIILFPIYSWGVPPIVLDYMEHLSARFLEELGGKPVYMVCTCGDETGLAPRMFCKSLGKVGLQPKGIWSIQMPNNYVLLPGFNIDSKELERKKLEAYPGRVGVIAEVIRKGESAFDYVAGSWPGLKTRVVFPLFKRWGIAPSKWTATEACIGCGKCEKACPMGNIAMHAHRPVWGRNCVSCLACYHICPANAVQYGNMTKGKGQYFFPATLLKHMKQ